MCLRQRNERDRARETAYKLMQWGCTSDWWQWEQVSLRSSELHAIQLNAKRCCSMNNFTLPLACTANHYGCSKVFAQEKD